MIKVYKSSKRIIDLYKENGVDLKEYQLPLVGCFIPDAETKIKPFIYFQENIYKKLTFKERRLIIFHEQYHIIHHTLDEKACDEYAEKRGGVEAYRKALIKTLKITKELMPIVSFNDLCLINSTNNYAHRTWLKAYLEDSKEN